jgi:cystathionine gamma-synthase
VTRATQRLHAATRAVRAGIDADPAHGAVTPSLVLSANFSFAGFGRKRAYDYSRSGNPTRDALAGALAELEGGVGAVVTASGMAAVTLVAHALLPPGARLVLAHDAYGGTWRLFDALATRGAIELVLADLTTRTAAFAPGTAVVWIETPSNPLLRITDLDSVVAAAHAAGALVVVDNTFLSPALQQPLAHGADVVVHSTTKYINGHSDVVGGAVVARDAAIAERIAWWTNALGVAGAPFDALLTLRGLRTLDARLAVHERNAAALAALLDGHPAVSAVHWPGLRTHRGHAIARRQQSGFGGMLSFELAGGEPAVRARVDGLACFTLAESLGGVESLVAHPATMTHASMSPEARAVAGIGAGLLRVSTGIEHADDLVSDLAAGLERAARATGSASARKRA